VSGLWRVIFPFLWAISFWELVVLFRRSGFTLIRFIWDFVFRLGGDLMGLFFDDEVGDDGASTDDPIEAKDMHAGSQAYAQTQGTSFAEAALPGHSTFEVAGMPMHYSPQFGPDGSSPASAPAYAAFQNFAMGGPLGSDSGAPPSGSAPLPGFGWPQMPPSNASAFQMHQRCKRPVKAFARHFLLPTLSPWRRLHLCAFRLWIQFTTFRTCRGGKGSGEFWKHIYRLTASTRWLSHYSNNTATQGPDAGPRHECLS
jgi:hypothetical protein